MPYRPYSTKVDGVDTILAEHVNSLQSDLSDLSFNVKGYGAVGDGVANDTLAIQNAIDAARAAGGGTVWIPTGTFLTNKLTLYSAVNLIGVGPHASMLKLRPSQNTALLTTDGFVTSDSAAGIHSFRIESLSFDGSKADQSSNADSGCVQLYGYNFDLRNVHIRNGKTVNLYTNWGTSAGAPGPAGRGMEARLYGVESYLAASDGIYWNGPHDSIWDAVISHENAAKGINIGARGNALKATNCHSWGTSQTYAWYIEGAALQAVNCEAEGASSKQVYIDVNDVSWIGGQVYAAGGATTGIELANSASGYNINTKILNCTTAALLFTSDGGGRADVVVYGTSGATFSGTISSDTSLRVHATGGQVPVVGDRKILGPWHVKNAGSPFSDQYFQINGGVSGDAVFELAMMRPGSITGIMIRSSENRTAGSFTAEVQKNGSKIGLAAVLDGSNVTFKATTQAPGLDTFAIGDVISVVWTTAGWTPTTADITCTVEITDG